jgi:hypothetical protein
MELANRRKRALRQVLGWFFGPRRSPSGRERRVLVVGLIAGVVLLALGGMHGWWNPIGAGLVGGCSGALMWGWWSRGVSARSESESKPLPPD